MHIIYFAYAYLFSYRTTPKSSPKGGRGMCREKTGRGFGVYIKYVALEQAEETCIKSVSELVL